MGVIDLLAGIADRLPTVAKPAQKPSLYRRLAWTGIVLVAYLVMAEIPLYGIAEQGPGAALQLQRIIFASSAGTLMELGIGPIVTAGLILQVLIGAKIIEMDLSNPEDRRRFTAAQKTLAVVFAVFEAAMFALGCRYWPSLGNPLTGCSAEWWQRLAVVLQLAFASYLVILMDEMLQKGWGIGSAISLFILAGVAQSVMWSLLGYAPGVAETYGLIPALLQSPSPLLLARPNGFPDITGLLATVAFILLLVYLQAMRIEIPVTGPRMRGIRSKVPLQFLYVTNIPILLVGILVADLQLFSNVLAGVLPPDSGFLEAYNRFVYYVTPPRGLVQSLEDPVRTVAFAVAWTVMAVAFGYMWVEIAGLNPREQAERLVKSGLEIPGVRKNPRILESILARYIYPLTLLSSLIVAAIAIAADIFGTYGTGMGILLAVGIINQYYLMISYERSLEAYPLLRRLLGEEL